MTDEIIDDTPQEVTQEQYDLLEKRIEEKKLEEKKPEKVWKKSSFYIHDEIQLEPTKQEQMLKAIGRPVNPTTAFKTFDKEVYVRDGISGVIKKATPKLKGKRMRKLEKRMRRSKKAVIVKMTEMMLKAQEDIKVEIEDANKPSSS